MSKKCPNCNSEEVTQLYCFSPKDGWQYRCESCQLRWYPDAVHENKQTVFHRITASPEVLAEKLVYCSISGWTSALINFHTFHHEEAIAATVAKLKEVAN